MVLKINSDYFHKQTVSAVQILVFVMIQLTYLLYSVKSFPKS
jgi:hypothetical protein